MASRRKGPALFEVIRAAQQKQVEQQRKLEEAKTKQPSVLQNAGALLGSPSYWLNKGKTAIANAKTSVTHHRQPVMREVAKPQAAAPQGSAPLSVPTVYQAPESHIVHQEPVLVNPIVSRSVPTAEVEKPFVQPEASVVPHEPVAAALVSAPIYESPAAAAARAVREEIAATSDESDSFIETKPERTIESVNDIFDTTDDQTSTKSRWFPLNLKLNYTTGVIAGCVLLGAVAIALIANHSRSETQQQATAGTVRPNAIDVAPAAPVKPQTPPQNNAVTPRPNNEAAAARPAPGSQNPTLKKEELPAQSVKVPVNVRREVGKQYVVLMSFPSEAQAKANELVKFLADNGIATTAEKGLPGYSKTWYSVVSVRGFDKAKSAELDNYTALAIKQMEKYARGSSFKSFKPELYSWKAN